MSEISFWDNYYKGKRLSGREFYRKRFLLIEMVIIALFVAWILLFVEFIFYDLPENKETLQTKLYVLLFIFAGAVFFYRYHLLKQDNKRKKK